MGTGKPDIIIYDTIGDLARSGADLFASNAIEWVRKNGAFTVALSGGGTPRPMFRLLTKEPCLSKVPWDGIHIFWTDERCVPEGDPLSNYGTARREFLDLVPIPPDQVHKIPVQLPFEEGALRYQEDIFSFFQPAEDELPVFDLIFLGIGVDGHIASLFPGDFTNIQDKRMVLPVKRVYPDVDRITMNYRLLNNAKKIAFLISGDNKSGILRDVLTAGQKEMPAQMIRPVNGELIFFLDREAAALLE